MGYVEFVAKLHTSTRRNYLQRVVEYDKAEAAEKAVRWAEDYWDGDRRYGYGGYRYDGRWRGVAEAIAGHYGLRPGARILDVGCGKGFLLYEFTRVVPGARVAGLDLSQYAIEHAKSEVKPFLCRGTAARLPFPDASFDLVASITTLHNLYAPDLWAALRELERVARGPKYVVVEAYRTEREKVNLMYWQLTCRAFHTPEEWKWIFAQTGYTGDYEFIFFE